MEVMPGYKKTDVGVIPEDWVVTPIGEFTSIMVGRDLKISHYSTYQDNQYKFPVFSNTVSNEGLYGYYNIPEYEGAGLTIVGRGVGLGTAFKRDGGFGAIGRLLVLFPAKHVDAKFLTDYINHRVRVFSESGGIPQLTGISIAKYRIPLPPTKEEQTKIATAVSDADSLISSLEKLIAKKRNIKQGAMQQLLQPKDGWEVKKLGEISSITKLAGYEYSKYFNSYRDGGEIIVVRGTNITNNKMDLSDIKTISRKTSNFLQRSKLYKGDIVFAYVGTIGPVFLIDEDNKYHLGPNTCKITANKEVASSFILTYFKSWLIKEEIVEHTSIGAQSSLSMTKIRKFRIGIPKLKAEQIRIANVLSDMDAEITALEVKLEKYRQIKQGMMQNLLTGKIRLV